MEEHEYQSRRKNKSATFYDLNGDGHEGELDNPAFVHAGTHTRYPGAFANHPHSGRQNIKPDSEQRGDKEAANRRAKIAIAVIVVILVLGVAGAIIGVVLTYESDSDSKSSSVTTTPAPTGQVPDSTARTTVTTPTATKIVVENYPGEATLKDLEYSAAFADPESALYIQTAESFIEKMDEHFEQSALSNEYNSTTVTGYRNGSLIIDFYITFDVTVAVNVEITEPAVDMGMVEDTVREIEIVESTDVAKTSQCASQPCKNGGTCEGGVVSYKCLCRPGYSGLHCEIDINECASNPCENDASCLDVENAYTCSCLDGFSGPHCEINIDECASGPCQNNGSCIDDVNSYTCKCMPGYTGNQCQTDINECESDPCLHGGACNDGINSFTCSCMPGYGGIYCQTNINECGSNPCLNGGSCTDGINFYSCMCLDGFMGDNCETDIDECGTQPCRNGGSCMDQVNSYTCVCANGYTGRICQTVIATSPVTSRATTRMSTMPPVTPSVPSPTIPPVQNINCTTEYDVVEAWLKLNFSYSRDLQNKSSSQYVEQSNFVYSVAAIVLPEHGPLLYGVQIVAFQRMNGTSNSLSTVQACVLSELSNPRNLYSTIGAQNTTDLGVHLIGFQGISTTSSHGRPVNFTCPATYHVCSDKNRCIPPSLICDGVIDCISGEDEASQTCPTNATSTGRPPVTSPGGNITTETTTRRALTNTTTAMKSTTPEPCPDDEYQCYTTYECINKDLVCDGHWNCKDNSDEWYCPTTPVSRPAAVEVRLMDGDTDTTSQLYGRVEVRPLGTDTPFGTICDDMWGVEEAKVVCSQLGHSDGSSVYAFHDARYGQGTGPIYLSNLRCTGDESNLMDCESTAEWGYVHCGHNQDAAVSCGFEATTLSSLSTTTAVMTTVEYEKIRLVGGSNCLEGKLEVLLNGQWGTVCDDYFSFTEARIVCKSLGFDDVEEYGNYLFNSVSNDKPINMDDVQCTGTESNIFECSYITQHNCAHYEDVGIICTGDPAVSCYTGPVVESVNCSFRQHNCQYEGQTLTGNATWKIGRYRAFTSEDAYMYLSNQEGSARLTSPQFEGSDMPMSVEFMYSIINSHYNNLILSLHESTTISGTGEVTSIEHELWNSIYLRSDEDSRWLYHCQDLTTTSDKEYNLVFEGRTDLDIQIALDSISLNSGKCQDNLLRGVCTLDQPNKCSAEFECGPCRRDVPTYRWYWTDMGSDFMGDKLIHANSVFGEEGDTAVVTFKLPYLQRGWFLKFRGHMGDPDTGMLKISLQVNEQDMVIDTLVGQQMEDWFHRCVKLPDVILRDSFDLDIQFEATRGSGPRGHIYVDDLEIVETCVETAPDLEASWEVSNFSEQYKWTYLGKPPRPILRLIPDMYDDETAGRVEIYHEGEWRGICARNYMYSSTDVICNMMGYLYGYYYQVYHDGEFWLSNINCTGTENSILDCDISDWGNTTGCTEYDHVHVSCYGDVQKTTYYFENNFFFMNDSGRSKGLWSALMSNKMISSDATTPQKLLFDVHKSYTDILKVYLQEESSNVSSLIDTITETIDLDTVCLDLPVGEYYVGITAIKDSRMESDLQLGNVKVKQGHCQGQLGRDVCSFQSMYMDCEYTVTSEEGTCGSAYRWSKVTASASSLDYTLKNSMGQFMYVNNLLGSNGDVSTLHFPGFDIQGDAVPFACSLKFAYFVSGGDLTVDINGRNEQLSPLTFRPHMWRQGCFMISPGESCPLQSGMVNISFVASGVEAGLDNVHISAETCPTTDDITCEFEYGEDCGYSWTANLTSKNGVIINTDVPGNITIASPVFSTTQPDICITFENTVQTDYNLTATVYDMQGTVINSTYMYSMDDNSFLTLDVNTVQGNNYIFFIEGPKPSEYYSSYMNISVDSVRFYSQSCSNIVFPCRRNEVECGDGNCTLRQNICDGKRDCATGKDEQMCVCDLPEDMYSMDPLFQCADSGCVMGNLQCDGIADCEDGSDEMCSQSISCEFDEPYVCGYSHYHAFYDIVENAILIHPAFGYLESPVVNITTASCMMIEYNWRPVSYINQTSFRVITNTSDSLNVLTYINTGYQDSMSMHKSWHIGHAGLPVGIYSVIIEAQGMNLQVASVSTMNRECDVPNVLIPPPMTTVHPSPMSSFFTSRPSHNTTMGTRTTEIVVPSDFPTVKPVVETVETLYGQSTDLSCSIVNSPDYEGTLFWYTEKNEVIARNTDIMLEDEEQDKYSAAITVTSDLSSILYTLTIHDVSPADTNKGYKCSMKVLGYPVTWQQEAMVYLSTEIPEGVESCVPNPLFACHEAGYPSYKLPSVTGLTNHSQVHDKLLNIFYSYPSMLSHTCQPLLRDLSCGLHTPKCDSDGDTVPVCRESCEDIASTCLQAHPDIVLNNNTDLSYFCKFLPYSSSDTCEKIYFECGSHINTTAKEFRIRSEGYPLAPSSSPCSYTISGPPMENYFKWIEISIESLTLDSQCGQSSLKVGNETLCSDSTGSLPRVIMIEQPSAELILQAGNTGAFVASIKYMYPPDLCDMYIIPYNTSLIEATQDLECSRWIISLHQSLHEWYTLQLDILSIDSGCIQLDNHTGSDRQQVCSAGKVTLFTKNVTVLRESDDVVFSLNYTAVLISETMEPDSVDPELLPIKLELVGGEREGSGLVQIYRADGVTGLVCNFDQTAAELACELTGQYPILQDFDILFSVPEPFTIISSYLNCYGADNLTSCYVDWLDQCDSCFCFGLISLNCVAPYENVSCDFMEDSQCGYNITADERSKSLLSPSFSYSVPSSVKLNLHLTGIDGDSLSVYMLQGANVESLVVANSLPLHVVDGPYELCIQLPDNMIDMEVRLQFDLTFRGKAARGFDLLSVMLHEESCPGVFPDTMCSFDNLGICLPLIEATCPEEPHGDRVWQISQGQLIGDSKQGEANTTYSFSFELPEVASPTTQYMHFYFMNNGSYYYENELSFKIIHFTSPLQQTVVYESMGTFIYGLFDCLEMNIVPGFGNVIQFELVSNQSLGYVVIDNITLNDAVCPHPASCDFERECDSVNVPNATNEMFHWNITDNEEYYGIDHTFQEYYKGHMISIHDNFTLPAGAEASFSLEAMKVDSRYQCLSFFYRMYYTKSPQAAVPFLMAHIEYTSGTEQMEKTYGLAEYRTSLDWKEVRVPVDPELGENMTITFTVRKLYSETQMWMYVDDIKLESSSCKYGIENMEVCTFDEPMKCLYTANCTEGSGYLWDLYKGDEMQYMMEKVSYLHVDSAYGKEGDESYLSFEVDLTSETSDLYYQFYVKSMNQVGSLQTFLYSEDTSATLNISNVLLQGGGVWYLSDCYSIPSSFKGHIYFLATRGQGHKGIIALDNVQIQRGTCSEPTISCDFTVQNCNYIVDGDWLQNAEGISSSTEGAALYVPVHKLEYQEGCLSFEVLLEEELSVLEVHVAMENETEVYKFKQESSNSFTGQVHISMTDTKSVKFVPGSNSKVTITSVTVSEGSCGPLSCGANEFECREKCILRERRCDSVDDCFADVDEDSCGFSLTCPFTIGGTCNYTDVSELPASWRVESSFVYVDAEGNDQTIASGDGGFIVSSFMEYTIAHAQLESKLSHIEVYSCLVMTYAGNVSKMELMVTYENGTEIHWNDTSVKGENLDWKTAMIDISQGFVTTLLSTSMASIGEPIPKLLKDTFLIVEDIRLESGKCENMPHPGCPSGTELCKDKSVCYPEEWFCDGVEQCPDGSDEIIERCLQVNRLGCTFEDQYVCRYRNLSSSTNQQWIRQKAYKNELPYYDHTFRNTSGHFLYYSQVYDLSGIAYNATAESLIVMYDRDVCLSFWYFLNSTRWQPNSLTAQLFVSVVYQDDLGMSHNLLWYDSADRYFYTWAQGAVPVQANRPVKLQLTAKTFTPVEIWPGMVAVDDIEVIEGDCPITQECGSNSFECTSPKVCIPDYFLCDGTVHCSDGSDERSCDKPEGVFDVIGGDGSYGQARVFKDSAWRPICSPLEEGEMEDMARLVCQELGFIGLAEGFNYTYPDSNQIAVKLNCSSEDHCSITTDYCNKKLGVKCSNAVCFAGYRLCPDTKSQCVPAGRFCDGLPDCDGNSDERDCGDCSAPGQFQCQNHECVPISARCDGISDCSDGTDELRCVQVEGASVTVWDKYSQTRKPVCIDAIDRQAAETLCRLSGSGYLDLPGIKDGLDTVEGGIVITSSADPSAGTLLPGLNVLSTQEECYPLELRCKHPECGSTVFMEEAVESYIFQGEKAVLGEWPWHCLMFASVYFLCGCSYIGENYILTAAHCIPPPQYNIEIHLGTLSRFTLGHHGQAMNVTRYTSHPDYIGFDGRPNLSDIAILELPSAPIIDNFTRPVCLGNQNDFDYIKSLGDDAECYLVGLGYTEQRQILGRDDSPPLLETRVRLIDWDQCNNTWSEFCCLIYDDSVCVQNFAPYGPVCSGDSGGSLSCKDPRNGRWTQFGVTSFGRAGCYSHELPDVYNSVPMFMDWIREVTGINFNKP